MQNQHRQNFHKSLWSVQEWGDNTTPHPPTVRVSLTAFLYDFPFSSQTSLILITDNHVHDHFNNSTKQNVSFHPFPLPSNVSVCEPQLRKGRWRSIPSFFLTTPTSPPSSAHSNLLRDTATTRFPFFSSVGNWLYLDLDLSSQLIWALKPFGESGFIHSIAPDLSFVLIYVVQRSFKTNWCETKCSLLFEIWETHTRSSSNICQR